MRLATALKNAQGSPLASQSDVATGGGASSVTLGSLMKPMKGVWPAVDATNGPLTADAITSGSPTTTGLRFIAPNSGLLKFQNAHMVSYANGAGANTSGSTIYHNAPTPRIQGYGGRANDPIEGNFEMGFVTNATEIIIAYFNTGYYDSTVYHDMQVYAEHEGQMKKLTTLPRTGSFTGLGFRRITLKEARTREFRVFMQSATWLIGVWVTNLAQLTPAPNRPLILMNGDSWNEPNGDTLQNPAGGAWPTGVFRSWYLPQALSEATGFCVGSFAQGGTGRFNPFTADNTSANANNVSNFAGQPRVTDFATKFAARSPIVLELGGYNDGANYTQAAYRTRVLDGIDRFIAAKSDIQMILAGIQPANSAATWPQQFYDMNAGISDAAALRPNNVAGFINLEPMWPDKSTSGQRGAMVGPDSLHLHIGGATAVAEYLTAALARIKVPSTYLAAQLAASTPYSIGVA